MIKALAEHHINNVVARIFLLRLAEMAMDDVVAAAKKLADMEGYLIPSGQTQDWLESEGLIWFDQFEDERVPRILPKGLRIVAEIKATNKRHWRARHSRSAAVLK